MKSVFVLVPHVAPRSMMMGLSFGRRGSRTQNSTKAIKAQIDKNSDWESLMKQYY